ncbi:uncharacterized mitochondrial protein AtMg00810-like [Capsicum annuum]|uniref:uncharacterized mitochondrial protein AtMg00810-like n=1 Tax=Capsicum annuum TaxID=4072 RepID=UPI001FB18CD7|nr:uncharacterized mitochondrial protein AtMg00810-like [Capsicum annuum]
MQQSTPIIFDTGAKEVDTIPESAANSTPAAAESSPTAETLPTAFEETDAVAQSLRRARKNPAWMMYYESVIREEKWRKAMDAEIKAIKRNDTWELIDLPDKHKIIVTKHGTIRLLIALAAQNLWLIFQLDVKSAFLHGYLEEECPYEPTFFVKIGEDGRMLIACLYVDNLIFIGNNKGMFSDFKRSMMNEFEMSDLGKMHYFLGLEVVQSNDGIFVSQKKYVQNFLNKFKMQNCNPTNIPVEFGLKLTKAGSGKKMDNTFYKQIMGSLMYLNATRPDIMYIVSLVSRYMECPTEIHLLAAKRILRYLQGTKDFGIFYRKGEKVDLIGFTDSDYAGDQDGRKSTSGYVFMLGTEAVSWSSKKQTVVTLSCTEAEFVTATACVCQAIWLRRILKKL